MFINFDTYTFNKFVSLFIQIFAAPLFKCYRQSLKSAKFWCKNVLSNSVGLCIAVPTISYLVTKFTNISPKQILLILPNYILPRFESKLYFSFMTNY